MTTFGWALVFLGVGLLAGLSWRPPDDDRLGFHALIAALTFLGLGVLLLMLGWQQYAPIDRRGGLLAPIAGAPLTVQVEP